MQMTNTLKTIVNDGITNATNATNNNTEHQQTVIIINKTSISIYAIAIQFKLV